MPQITLPDGSSRQFDNPVSVFDVAADIGPGLAKAALAGRLTARWSIPRLLWQTMLNCDHYLKERRSP